VRPHDRESPAVLTGHDRMLDVIERPRIRA